MSPSPHEPAPAAILAPVVACGLLAVFLIMAVPLFVAAPVTSDTSLFDVQAMTVLKGGTLYRDVLEPNLPGIVWLHLAIRSVVGWSSEAIRIVDLLLFGTTVFLLSCLVRRDDKQQSSIQHLPLLALVTTLFYLTRNEWCHCQRDIWMMVPASGALLLRFRRTTVRMRSCVLEGAFWGIAFWIKPHIAIPAAAVVVVDLTRRSDWRAVRTDVSGMIAGGITIAIPGIAWLMATGAWDHFWIMMLDWNPEYLATGKTRRSWERLSFLAVRFWPWWLIHIVTVPVAVRHLRTLWPAASDERNDKTVLLSACYLAWLIQTFTLQHAMDYIHVPEVLLAICVLARHPWKLDRPVRQCAVAGLLIVGTISAPQFHHGRLSTWWTCCTHGSTAETRDVLAQGNFPNWIHLDRVRAFLAEQEARDGDIACLNVHSIHLHKELGVLPSSRYWCVSHPLTMYPSRFDQIMAAIQDPEPRFVVVEKTETAIAGQVLPAQFPGQYPVIFESGTYRVFATRPARIAHR